MIHLGDITKLHGDAIPPVDCITGGSPCQDLSVAGKRAGLAGERSGLFMEQIRIVKEMRERDRRAGRTAWAVRPRFMVWENVPGAFSSNKGEDFKAVLEEIVKIAEPDAPPVPLPDKGKWTKAGCLYSDVGDWSVAWRVHDAQFWGVPQRRKRIALVADFGGLAAPEILFERTGLSRDSKQSGAQGQGASAGIEGGAGSTVYGIDHVITTGGNCTAQGPCIYEDVEATLKAAGPHAVFAIQGGGQTSSVNGEKVYIQTIDGDITGTVTAAAGGTNTSGPKVFSRGAMSFQERAGKPGGGKGILIQREHIGALSTLNNQSVLTYSIGSMNSEGMKSDNPQSGIGETDVARTIDANGGSPTGYQGGIAIAQSSPSVFSIGHDIRSAGLTSNEITDPMTASDYKDPIIIAKTYQDVTGALTPGAHPGSYNGQDAYNDMLVTPSVVRRLTPMECERLQGFPDGWTDIGDWVDSKGKKHKEADSPRYKALGNSIALPFWFWLLRRISAQYERPATLGSLFDGIGGFPLCWERCNGKGTAIWASEIEEFPIAVTKVHFPEETQT